MIRVMNREDFKSFWPVFSRVVSARETYAFEPEITLEQAYHLWCELPLKSYVYIDNGEVLGSYYIKPNAAGPGNHVCNCGYMVAEQARGKGIARALCEHSQQQATEFGFKAMQYNSVVSVNEVAVKLWQKLGFEIVGRVPKAYRHARLGFVDTFVMYKWLGTSDD
ncbi:GNAT family N-acetyltransferase [Oceanimonas baumannii]|uniref:Acetyltransferase (GNAT) family protein n=1 Tax=Oceanimonas baumannii TaxID=129578 RepID=A0A235CHP3_9GAMM|nr:GNAT family N-acetyltransferase [Oceanimonas baumannii]OYD23894.1 GNAT family N-acetyltransferase [Oceanimonas baumannii]TDW58775.1 acetyltransferase (GNAT) family protein [Oceanimonas baumannii]